MTIWPFKTWPFKVDMPHPLWWLQESVIYRLPEIPPRQRTKPMEVLCVGISRSGTESLQRALLALGYDHTYHGFDMTLDRPNPYRTWARLAQRKYALGPWAHSTEGERAITAADFDALLGHAVAVTDIVGWFFAAELIAAYPDAKVVLNYRPDLDAWHRSMEKTILGAYNNWFYWILSWLESTMWWNLYGFYNIYMPLFFRMGPGGDVNRGVRGNGKWVYREHCNMIRGLVPKERLLEWTVEDGWEPLCAFLGKEIPAEPFPHANASGGEYEKKERAAGLQWLLAALRNVSIIVALAAMAGIYVRQR